MQRWTLSLETLQSQTLKPQSPHSHTCFGPEMFPVVHAFELPAATPTLSPGKLCSSILHQMGMIMSASGELAYIIILEYVAAPVCS